PANLLASAALVAASLPALAAPDGGGTPPVNPPAATQASGKDAEAAQFLKDLKAQMPKQADQDAKTAIKKLVDIAKDKEVSDETKKSVPDLLALYAKDEKRTAIASAAIDGLGEVGGAASADALLAILDRTLKDKEPSAERYFACLKSLR